MSVDIATCPVSPGAEALMRAVLRAGAPIAPEYPLVFATDHAGACVTAEENEGGESTVVSACTTLVRELVAGPVRFRAGLMGSVVTEPKRRGQGLATRVLRAAEEEFARAGCALSMLWADDPTFYMERGYFPVGTELDVLVPFDPIAATESFSVGVRHATKADYPALRSLYATHPERVERSAREFEALIAIPGVEVLVRERKDRVVAYSCLGRGADLAGVVHEWAGTASDVVTLLAGHMTDMRHRGEAHDLVVMLPPTANELSTLLGSLETPSMRGVLGMGRLVSAPASAELMRAVAEVDGVEAVIHATLDPAGIRVQGPRGAVVLDMEDSLFCLFGPSGDRGPVEALEEQTGLQLPSLPLAPFVWGLDSI